MHSLNNEYNEGDLSNSTSMCEISRYNLIQFYTLYVCVSVYPKHSKR